MMLPVNEVFDTIQGEATFTGTPAVFVRLQGCAVGCPWCDTKHTWAVDYSNQVTPDVMADKTVDAATFAMLTTEQIVARTAGMIQHVVLTGGEPCDYDLVELTAALAGFGKTAQIETSGTSEIRVHDKAWVTLSPKVGMPGRRLVLADALQRADEIKMPVGKPADIDRLTELLRHVRAGVPIWLQPLSLNPKATSLCVSEAMANGWKVSLQTHKFLGVR